MQLPRTFKERHAALRKGLGSSAEYRSLLYITAIGALVMVLMGMFLFVRARSVMQDQLRHHLRSTAAAAAINIDGDRINEIRGRDDMGSPYFVNLVQRLDALRTAMPEIRFAYILRKTQDPAVLAFVADADSLASLEELDENANGMVDPDEEASYPGELYDVSEITALQGEAFERATSDEEMEVDQWGALMSGYAPIRTRSTGEVVAVLGIDMEADSFNRLAYGIFSPGALVFFIFVCLFVGAIIMMAGARHQITLLEKINAERSGLLQLTFHQLGEPLTIMKWSLETLREEKAKIPTHAMLEEHFACMDEGLTRLDAIIEVLQQAEKVDLGSMDWHPEETELKPLVEFIIHNRRHTFSERKGKVHVEIDDGFAFAFDKALIGMVIGTLLDNAADYSPEDHPIVIRAKKRRDTVVIEVEDEGYGIPKADLKRIGEKYGRGSNAHLYRPDGNGLGIYTARGIVERAGGTLSISSSEGKGTTITFTLPA